MLTVLLIFLSPFGAGIPAGVLLAQSRGLPWPLTAGLYFVSDVILALVLEPVIRLLVAWGRRVPVLARLGEAMKLAMAQSVAQFGGTTVGPVALVLIAFGLDPITGRATALAAGHGPLAGWAFAITGDMLYYAVIAVTTLRLNAVVKHPSLTIWMVLGAMLLVPMLIRAIGSRLRRPR